ncbi:MAG: efflux RND transporter permease subunit, partial [Rhodothermaceae bacterium]|nr:efflux RND transporter permease subunit [Rhodothermaceae bacterium]
GTAEVGGAVVASTATTVAAFAPMLFWPGIIGEFMSYLPLTLIITLTSSLFVAIIINPVITGIFVKLDSEERKKPTRTARIVTAVTVAALGLILALTNINTFIVLACAIPLFYVLNRFFFKPVGDNFVQKRLPQLVEWYRGFLKGMLTRDYSKKSNYLKNSLALGCFTLGVVLAILGGVVSSTMGQTAGMILLAPGGLLAVVGLVGVILHTFESFIYVVQGFFGKAKNMILTDNRSRLLNSTMGALVLILVLFVLFPTGVEFFPTTDPNQVAITFEAPLGTNVDASNQIAKQAQQRIDDLLNENPNARSNVKNVLANVGIGGDAMFGGGSASPEVSRVTLNLIDYEDRATPSPQTMDALREQLKGIPGTEVTFTQDQSGPPTADPVNIEVTGEDFGEIVRITRDIKSILTAASESGKIPGLVDVNDNLNTGRPELNVKIDRIRAAQFGLSTSQIATTVRSAINGTEAGTLRDGDEEYDITVRLSEEDRASLESIRSLTIPYEGEQIPLVSVAETEVSGGFGSVTRLDLSRVATVSGKAATGYNGNAILAQVVQELAPYQETIPEGYQLNFTGESEEQQESFGFLTYVLLIGVSLIFMIMVAQFNSISTPFIIMVAVGLGLIGVLLGLVLTRTEFGLMTFIGIISLAGIVVNNNIVLIDYIEQLRRKGLSKLDAVIEGGATRLRPVVLTALTTVLGLIPLTFGINIDFVGLLTDLDANFRIGSQNTQFWGPMGTAIISGLTFATFLTLVIVPVMYSVFDSLGKHLGILFKGPKAEEDSQISPQEGDGFTEEVDNLAPKYATDTK